MKLLVADDERWIRKGILKMIDLENFGFQEVLEAGNLTEYEEIFKSHLPDVVVSDVRFSSGTSCELCQKLYNLKPKTKFIMLSGYDDFQYVKSAFGYKAVDYLLKPVDKGVLNHTIRKALEELGIEKGQEISEIWMNNGQKNGEQIIYTVIKEIEKDCRRKYTLSKLAEEYHISEAYFSNLFAKTAGISLMNYIMEVRVEKAKALLLQTEMKITEIALAVGYEDHRYFAKVFRKITGESPSDYRFKQRQDDDKNED